MESRPGSPEDSDAPPPGGGGLVEAFTVAYHEGILAKYCTYRLLRVCGCTRCLTHLAALIAADEALFTTPVARARAAAHIAATAREREDLPEPLDWSGVHDSPRYRHHEPPPRYI